jgi:hypothetical protein
MLGVVTVVVALAAGRSHRSHELNEYIQLKRMYYPPKTATVMVLGA